MYYMCGCDWFVAHGMLAGLLYGHSWMVALGMLIGLYHLGMLIGHHHLGMLADLLLYLCKVSLLVVLLMLWQM